jgi:hypothetical protein
MLPPKKRPKAASVGSGRAMEADALRKKPRRLGCTVHVQSLSELRSVFLSL